MAPNTRVLRVFLLVLFLLPGSADQLEGSPSPEKGISYPKASIKRSLSPGNFFNEVEEDTMGEGEGIRHSDRSIRRKIFEDKEDYSLRLRGVKSQNGNQPGPAKPESVTAEKSKTTTSFEGLTKSRLLIEVPRELSAVQDARSRSSTASDCTSGDNRKSGICPPNNN